MQSHSLSVDTLKDNLLRAIDAEYNVKNFFLLNKISYDKKTQYPLGN
jgi:hypothetical protein